MRSPSCPHSARPSRQSAACWPRTRPTSRPFAVRRRPGSTQGRKSSGRSCGKVSSRFAEVALGIDHDGGDAVDRRLLEQADAEPGLAAARHADADGVRDEVSRVVQQPAFSAPLRGQVVRAAEIERAELFECLHAGSLRQFPPPFVPARPAVAGVAGRAREAVLGGRNPGKALRHERSLVLEVVAATRAAARRRHGRSCGGDTSGRHWHRRSPELCGWGGSCSIGGLLRHGKRGSRGPTRGKADTGEGNCYGSPTIACSSRRLW